MAAPASPPPLYRQLELPLEISASPGFSVSRLPSGHVVLAPRPLDLWGSTEDAARMIRRSERWVRALCANGTIRARRLPGARRWDVDLVDLQEWAAKSTKERQ